MKTFSHGSKEMSELQIDESLQVIGRNPASSNSTWNLSPFSNTEGGTLGKNEGSREGHRGPIQMNRPNSRIGAGDGSCVVKDRRNRMRLQE